MVKEFSTELVIEDGGVWVKFFDKTYNTGFVIAISDSVEYLKSPINNFLLLHDRKGKESSEVMWRDWNDFGDGLVGLTWFLEDEFLIVIAVKVRESDKLHETQQTLLHECIHGTYRSLEFNNVKHYPDCHEHFVLYFDRICSEIVPHFWTWVNDFYKQRKELKQ